MVHGNDLISSAAITLRPHPLTDQHKQKLLVWLAHKCVQWEFFTETTDGTADTEHLHGRVLLKNPHTRMDHLKTSLITALHLVTAEKRVLQKGIKWLYDDWEYAGKDGNLFSRHIFDEDAWVYADPKNKTEKQKNAWIHHWLKFIEPDLSPEPTSKEVEDLIMPHMARDHLEMLPLPQLRIKCATFAHYLKARNMLDLF